MSPPRGFYRSVYGSMTRHPDFDVLTPHERLTLLVLRVGGQSTIAGIGVVYLEGLCAETGLTPRQVKAALCTLEQKPTPEAPWILRDGNLIWVRNALRFDPNLSLANPKHAMAVYRAAAALPPSPIVRRFREYYGLPEAEVSATHAHSHPDTHAHSYTDGYANPEAVAVAGAVCSCRNRTPSSAPTGDGSPGPPLSLSLSSNDGGSNDEAEAITSHAQAIGKRLGFVEQRGGRSKT